MILFILSINLLYSLRLMHGHIHHLTCCCVLVFILHPQKRIWHRSQQAVSYMIELCSIFLLLLIITLLIITCVIYVCVCARACVCACVCEGLVWHSWLYHCKINGIPTQLPSTLYKLRLLWVRWHICIIRSCWVILFIKC